MRLITGFQNGMSTAPCCSSSCPSGCRGRLSITPIKSTRLDLGSSRLPLSCIVGYSLQVESNCVVPKNLAGLSTHAAPCSPLTLPKSPTDLIEIPSRRGGCCTHHQREMYGWTFVSNGHPSHPLAVTIDPTHLTPLPCILFR